MWGMIAGAVLGGLSGAGADKDANAETNANYVDAQNSAAQQYAGAQNTERSSVADVANQWTTAQWQSDNALAQTQGLSEGAAQQGMFGTKYGIALAQANYDALQGEFGDMADNIAGHFKSLSPSSMKAQNNDRFNAAYAKEIQGLEQTLASRGIKVSSGLALALQGMASMTNATSKVMANRNVESEVAGQQMNFLGQAENSQLFHARPEDFNAGIMSQDQLGLMAPQYSNPEQIDELTPQGYEVAKANVLEGEKQSGGWLSGAVGGAAGAIFG